MARTKSSTRWLKEHFTDPFVKAAQQAGYRSRAAYKLLAIQERDKLLRSGMQVVDLGAAPGGWSQVAAKQLGKNGKIIAVDLLTIAPMPNVSVIQGDFTEELILNTILQQLNQQQVDVILSDMSPNVSGIKGVDLPRMMYLAELVLDFAQQVLKTGGALLIKVFQGEGIDAYIRLLRANFTQVSTRKPPASRSRSKEIYLLARGYKGKH